jgi:hypothetical protein
MSNGNDVLLSEAINLSRDETRNQVILLLQDYLELENVDLTKSSFLSYIINVISTMISNVLFYQISVYREFFLTKAQLPESVYNLAAFLGYEAGLASFARVDILFTMPLGFEDPVAEFEIPEGFEVKSNDGVFFTTDYLTTITVTNNSSVKIIGEQGSIVFDIPVVIDTDEAVFSFVLSMNQKTLEVQEFQINADLQTYQFYVQDVPFSGKLTETVVEIKSPDAPGYELYTQFSSLYLMDENDKGYVLSRTEVGMNLAFGNGIIGVQPPPGGTLRVTLSLTQGEDGNAIAGSVKSGERIYNETDTGTTEIVQYEIVNTSAAIGGLDEESIDEVRRNAIINITALERLVSENDYINADIIIDDSPIAENSLPVLKRSDVKYNEIMLFITLLFEDEIVPTRNVFWEFATGTVTVPRNTILTFNGIDYYTIFDMTIEVLNTVADYTYVLFELEQVPILVTSFGSDYNFVADNLVVERQGAGAQYTLRWNSTEDDPGLVSCEMEILESGQTFSLINVDATANEFVLILPDYTVIPEGELTYYFTLSHPTEGLIGRYQNTLTFRQSLENLTRSNTINDTTAGVVIVYDIPTVRKDYYDGVNQREFEAQVLQSMLSSMTFKDYKMLTDFVNVKFSNTTGLLQNMELNPINRLPVIAIDCSPPLTCNLGDRYIVSNGVGEWEGHNGEIAECSDATNITWVFVVPNTDDFVYVQDEGTKYIYNSGWFVPSYDIPLVVSMDVFKTSTYSGSLSALTDSIRETLIIEFSDKFGINKPIYRSELIETIQNVDGVQHCRLITPESNIFFDFNIDNFTQQQLLEYAPEYVYFTEESIVVKVFT